MTTLVYVRPTVDKDQGLVGNEVTPGSTAETSIVSISAPSGHGIAVTGIILTGKSGGLFRIKYKIGADVKTQTLYLPSAGSIVMSPEDISRSLKGRVSKEVEVTVEPDSTGVLYAASIEYRVV